MPRPPHLRWNGILNYGDSRKREPARSKFYRDSKGRRRYAMSLDVLDEKLEDRARNDGTGIHRQAVEGSEAARELAIEYELERGRPPRPGNIASQQKGAVDDFEAFVYERDARLAAAEDAEEAVVPEPEPLPMSAPVPAPSQQAVDLYRSTPRVKLESARSGQRYDRG
jgi:hypothetical protein